MPKDNENLPFSMFTDENLEAPRPQPFLPDQMVRCEACLRANPPTRVNCIYCGAGLPATEHSIDLQKPALRPLEEWKRGYNNIVLPGPANPELGETDLVEAADILKLAPADVTGILAAGLPLPIARSATVDDATLLERRLGRLGIETRIFSDDKLGQDGASTVRVRAAEIESDTLRVFPHRESPGLTLPWTEIVLLVQGRLIVRRVELREQKRAGKEDRILDATELFSDELVFELYTRDESSSWRFEANSFDFSCLGATKGLLAGENILALVQLVQEQATGAEVDRTYNAMRKTLELVWPPEQRNDSSGWRRERPGKYSVGSVTELSNETQFLKYSRLRYLLQVENWFGNNENS